MSRAVQSLDLRIRNARPKGREHTIACGGGLVVRVLPLGATGSKGTKIFTLRFRPKGSSTQRRVTIGHYPDVTLDTARTEAARMRSEVRNGRDPVVEAKRQQLAADAPATVDQLVSRFLTGHVRLKNKASTAAETERILKTYVQPTLGKRRLQDIQRSDMTSLIRKEAERIMGAREGARGTAANRIKAAVSKLFAFAVSEGWLEINPASGIPPVVNEKSRERTLSAQEIGQLWNELAKPRESASPLAITHRVVALLLLTGARASEIATLRLRHFSKEASAIALEDTKTKGGNRVVPLSAAALAIVLPAIQELKRNKPDSYLFPAVPKMQRRALSGGGLRTPHIHRESVTRAGARIAVDLGHTKPVRWTVHDLRRTFITWAHETGHEPDLVRRVTGHAARDVHGRVYDRSKRLQTMRLLLNEWAAYVAECGAKEAATAAPNILQLNAAKRP